MPKVPDRTAPTVTDRSHLLDPSAVEIMSLVNLGLALCGSHPSLTTESIGKLTRSLRQQGIAEERLQWLQDRQNQFTQSGLRVLREFYRALGALAEAETQAPNFKPLQSELEIAGSAVSEVVRARELLAAHERLRQDRLKP